MLGHRVGSVGVQWVLGLDGAGGMLSLQPLGDSRCSGRSFVKHGRLLGRVGPTRHRGKSKTESFRIELNYKAINARTCGVSDTHLPSPSLINGSASSCFPCTQDRPGSSRCVRAESRADKRLE